MATVLRTPTFRPPLPPRSSTPISSKSPKPFFVSFRRTSTYSPSPFSSLRLLNVPSIRFLKFVPFAYNGETETTETQEFREPEDSSDGAVGVESRGDDKVDDVGEICVSPLLTWLQTYKEALANNDEAKVAELESSLQSIEDERNGLEGKVTSLSEELSVQKERILRVSADFDNFRKRTERERLSLLTNAQGEVAESFLSVLDNFERAKAQIKVDTEGEEKINNSYQSIYKQFNEILSSLGVEAVETVGKPFDPLASKLAQNSIVYLMNFFKHLANLLHEAVMREDSTKFEDGVIIEEFRKGFKLGDRLLRPSMVKVSSGPAPSKPEQEEKGTTENSEVSADGETA